jgi:hypothetical protein
VAADQSAAFILTRQKFAIFGIVTAKPSTEVKDVTIRWDGEAAGSTSTNEKGEYRINDLPAGGDYRITPEKLHYSFAPLDEFVSSLAQDTKCRDFAMTIAIYSISGIFREFVPGKNTEEDNGPCDAVDVRLSGDVVDKMRTSSNGIFRFDVPALGKYLLEFSRTKFEFVPASPIQFASLTSTWDREIEARDTTWKIKGGPKPPRAPRWYDALPRDTDGWGNWDAANSIASGRGVHSADHLPGLIAAVGQGNFTRTDVLPRIVAYAIQYGNNYRTNFGISRHYRITTLPHQNGTAINLTHPIVVVWNYVVNPLLASSGTVYDET